jgi:hypothetical protein
MDIDNFDYLPTVEFTNKSPCRNRWYEIAEMSCSGNIGGKKLYYVIGKNSDGELLAGQSSTEGDIVSWPHLFKISSIQHYKIIKNPDNS